MYILSLTIIDFFLLEIEHCITNNLISLINNNNLSTGFFIKSYLTNDVFCTTVMFLTNAITISFLFLKTHLVVQISVIFSVKVNVSPVKLTSSLLSCSKQKVIVFKTDLFIFCNELFQGRKMFYTRLVYLKEN